MEGRIVWLASFLKSGNTWLRLLLANLCSDEECPVSINAITLQQDDIVNRFSFEEQALLDSSLLLQHEIDELIPAIVEGIAARASSDIYIKIHDAYRHLDDGKPIVGCGYRGVSLYIIRDPRDVAVSSSFHCGISIDRAIAYMNTPHCMLGGWRKRFSRKIPQEQQDWSRHVESWVDQKDLPVHIVRYEDLHEDPVANLRKITRFLGMEFTEEKIRHAVRSTEFPELQRQELKSGFCERSPESSAPFFRSGRVGGWREILTEEQQEAIMRQHRHVMERFGYL